MQSLAFVGTLQTVPYLLYTLLHLEALSNKIQRSLRAIPYRRLKSVQKPLDDSSVAYGWSCSCACSAGSRSYLPAGFTIVLYGIMAIQHDVMFANDPYDAPFHTSLLSNKRVEIHARQRHNSFVSQPRRFQVRDTFAWTQECGGPMALALLLYGLFL